MDSRWQSQEIYRVATEWSKKAKRLNGQEWIDNALKLNRITMNSCGKAVLEAVKAMNGGEWLRKSYEGRLLATEIPLKRL